MLLQTLFLSLLSTTTLALPPTPLSKRQNNNFNAGVCVIYWVPGGAENTPMNIYGYDAALNPLFHDTTTLLPSWSNNEAHVLIYELDRWIGIQSQPNNLYMLAYGSNTRIVMDPNNVVTIQDPSDSNYSPPAGTCAKTLQGDPLHYSANLLKCMFNCGPGY